MEKKTVGCSRSKGVSHQKEKKKGTMNIPHIICQTWKTHEVPKELASYVESVKRLNPTYQYRMWLDADLRACVARVVPHLLRFYDTMEKNIERVDFARYAIMYEQGGIYLDLDIEMIRPLDSLWKTYPTAEIVLSLEPREHVRALYSHVPYVVCNAMLASVPRHRFWIQFMHHIADNYDLHDFVVHRTGPMALTNFIRHHPALPSTVRLLSACAFFGQTDHYTQLMNGSVPYASEECKDMALERDAWGIHRWAHLWVEPRDHKEDTFREADIEEIRGLVIGLVVATVIGLPLLWALRA
jgi:hypothetical protein